MMVQSFQDTGLVHVRRGAAIPRESAGRRPLRRLGAHMAQKLLNWWPIDSITGFQRLISREINAR